MNAVLLAALAVVSVDGRFAKHDSLNGYHFDQYLHESGKKYEGSAYETRRDIFEMNLKKIQAHNNNPHSTYKMGVNRFTDRTPEELKHTLGGNKHALTKTKGLRSADDSFIMKTDAEKKELMASLPYSKDWRGMLFYEIIIYYVCSLLYMI